MRARKGLKMFLSLALTATAGFAGALVWMRGAGAEGIPTAPTLQYAGTLIDNGMPVSGMRTVNVSLWSQPDNGTQLCTTSDVAVAVTGGRFRVPLDACLDQVRAQPNLWVQVSSGASSWPRTKLGAAPYAIEAERATAAGGALAAQLAQLTQATQQAATAIPAGAVMAFDLGACPTGWTELAEAQGRTIVGAQARAAGGLSARPARSTGGAEAVALSADQLPAHKHTLVDRGHVHPPSTGATFVTGGSPGQGPANISQTGVSFVVTGVTGSATTGIEMESAGGGQPFAVMPPYLALLYCRKN
jgi:microcystin-dependent protein